MIHTTYFENLPNKTIKNRSFWDYCLRRKFGIESFSFPLLWSLLSFIKKPTIITNRRSSNSIPLPNGSWWSPGGWNLRQIINGVFDPAIFQSPLICPVWLKGFRIKASRRHKTCIMINQKDTLLKPLKITFLRRKSCCHFVTGSSDL